MQHNAEKENHDSQASWSMSLHTITGRVTNPLWEPRIHLKEAEEASTVHHSLILESGVDVQAIHTLTLNATLTIARKTTPWLCTHSMWMRVMRMQMRNDASHNSISLLKWETQTLSQREWYPRALVMVLQPHFHSHQACKSLISKHQRTFPSTASQRLGTRNTRAFINQIALETLRIVFYYMTILVQMQLLLCWTVMWGLLTKKKTIHVWVVASSVLLPCGIFTQHVSIS